MKKNEEKKWNSCLGVGLVKNHFVEVLNEGAREQDHISIVTLKRIQNGFNKPRFHLYYKLQILPPHLSLLSKIYHKPTIKCTHTHRVRFRVRSEVILIVLPLLMMGGLWKRESECCGGTSHGAQANFNLLGVGIIDLGEVHEKPGHALHNACEPCDLGLLLHLPFPRSQQPLPLWHCDFLPSQHITHYF